jgi:predicted nucleic acid-binding protein
VIVVDVNVLACLLIPGKRTTDAERLLESDAVWAAPRLWGSELRNVLATYLRGGLLDIADAAALFQRADELIGAEQYEMQTLDVLRLSRLSGCSASDCEYVALAEFLRAELFTADVKLAKAFPQYARLLAAA